MLKDFTALIPLHDHGEAIGWPNILPLVWIYEERRLVQSAGIQYRVSLNLKGAGGAVHA